MPQHDLGSGSPKFLIGLYRSPLQKAEKSIFCVDQYLEAFL